MNKFIKRWKTAFKGVKNAAQDWRFLLAAILSFLFFILLFNLFSAGNNFWQLIISLPFLDKFLVIGDIYMNFLVNFFSFEKILIFIAALGQALVIGMIIYLWRIRQEIDDKALLGSAGASLIALIGAGCPMCGGTILLPILMSIFGMSAMAFLQGISISLMILALIPIAFAIRRLGFLCSMQPKPKKKKEENEKS